MAQADLSLVPKVGGHWRCFCIHRVNRVNSGNALSMMTAPQRLSWLLLLLLLLLLLYGEK